MTVWDFSYCSTDVGIHLPVYGVVYCIIIKLHCVVLYNTVLYYISTCVLFCCM